ncbi:CBS domain-containing protein [Plantactinospora sp. KLBMP9567]|uniref:restriction system modified-DNA reader domain-containing protein n=1 Tax=Plantactinospora sp. KLBMP9567 TaxID=3085900 RepID=UPI0029814333|nr:CBS domain-containing protein [Plantactinospora sp. KLBMP9567]MDW5329065.1 CBS domain-containing protein [Plantactinospora sp. KLBMP9567]
MTTEPPRRRHPLINGRRVRVSDLLDAGMVNPDQAISYRPPHSDLVHRALITSRGRIRLSDGREFSTPSGAATAVNSARAVHGWYAWRLDTDGPFLHELRRLLLQAVADETSGADESEDAVDREAVRRRFGMLNEASRRAENGDPVSLTVRELIRHWGFEERDRDTSQQIDADLANHGLVSAPDFRAVNLEHTVTLVALPAPGDEGRSGATGGHDSGTLQAELTDEASADIGVTLGNLLSNDERLVSVSPSALVQEAITIMRLNDFSQLAVLTAPDELHGAVSWKSIAQAQHAAPDAPLGRMISPAKAFDYDVRLLDVIDILWREEFVFVRDFKGEISGIITAADVVQKYDETATPFLLIGEIDQELRRLIQNTFDLETAQQACGGKKSPKSFDRMTMGQYQAIISNPECWQTLGWPLDRAVFIKRLDEIRQIRNRVMHFNPDPVKPADVHRLRYFLDLIRTFNT